jgi:hypothetical protein
VDNRNEWPAGRLKVALPSELPNFTALNQSKFPQVGVVFKKPVQFSKDTLSKLSLIAQRRDSNIHFAALLGMRAPRLLFATSQSIKEIILTPVVRRTKCARFKLWEFDLKIIIMPFAGARRRRRQR